MFVDNSAGYELVLVLSEAGSWPSELTVNIRQPDNTFLTWDPSTHQDGESSHETGDTYIGLGTGGATTGVPLIMDQVGTYVFNFEDSFGDGPNGGAFEVVQALAGSFEAAQGPPPAQYWDPGYGWRSTASSAYGGYTSSASYTVGYSNTMDGVLLQNTGANPVDYEFVGTDTYGDGWHGNYMRMQVAPIGTWSTSTTGYPPLFGNTGGGLGTTIGGIGGSSQAYTWVQMPYGSESPPIILTLDPGMEMRFAFHNVGSWANEINLRVTELVVPDNSWSGPVIADNDINFDSTNNNPNAVGLFLSNCDIQDYTITTQRNTIDIGQNAVINDGCAWNDQSSVLTGFGLANSMGYNDDNTFAVNLNLDGTVISGFETGIYKTGGGVRNYQTTQLSLQVLTDTVYTQSASM